LCIARCLAVDPSVLLFDEPCASLDPISTGKIEELILELKKKYTIVIVTHNMQQAARVSDYTGFFLMGEMVEFGKTQDIFTAPTDKRTEAYIPGDSDEKKKRVLFVCVENACRSQMAEGFARQLGGHVLESYSAGSHPSGKINADAVYVMQEAGVISAHSSPRDLRTCRSEISITWSLWDAGISARSCRPSVILTGTWRTPKANPFISFVSPAIRSRKKSKALFARSSLPPQRRNRHRSVEAMERHFDEELSALKQEITLWGRWLSCRSATPSMR